MNKIIVTILLYFICFTVQPTKCVAHKDEIKIQIVHSNSFDSFVSNFGQNFNSFLVILLRDSNFDNEPFYIKNLAFLFENTDLVVKRTDYVTEFVFTRSENILQKYFSEIDITVCENALTNEVNEKIIHILSNCNYIEHIICRGYQFCFVEKILQIVDTIKSNITNDSLYDYDFLSNYKTFLESIKFKTITSLILYEYIEQYVTFMTDPTYNNFILVIDNFFTNIDNKLDSDKHSLDSLIYDFNRINKATCQKIFDIDALTTIDDYITKIVGKYKARTYANDDDDYSFM